MSALIDPTTGRELPTDSIQRVLFVSRTTHVYNPPALTNTSQHIASTWTTPVSRQIFTARLRILETATPLPSGGEKLKADILLEDASTGELFAAAPYTSAAVVEPVSDSVRFFAVRVQDPAGRKATLGIGFEERTEAFDFSVALQEIRKTLNIVQPGDEGLKKTKKLEKDAQRDFSLKEGETITISLGGASGGKGRRAAKSSPGNEQSMGGGFSLPPPPGDAQSFGLPPPPSTSELKAQKRLSANLQPAADDSGFDDGEFGEFQ